MALQEYLVSYGVQVDEASAERLFSVLEENRARAAELTNVFAALDGAVKEFSRSLAALGASEGLAKNGILSAADMKKLTPTLTLKADTAEFLRSAEDALEQVRSMAAGMSLTVPVRLQPDMSALANLSLPAIPGSVTLSGGTAVPAVNISVETGGASSDTVSRAVTEALQRRLGGGAFA